MGISAQKGIWRCMVTTAVMVCLMTCMTIYCTKLQCALKSIPSFPKAIPCVMMSRRTLIC